MLFGRFTWRVSFASVKQKQDWYYYPWWHKIDKKCMLGGLRGFIYFSAWLTNYVCFLFPAWSGNVCETPVDECLSNPCSNGGTCTDHVGEYTCACIAGWTGKTCAINIDDCADTPCHNGGTCTDGVDSHTCACAAGWGGVHCEDSE